MMVNLGHNGREEQVHEFPTRLYPTQIAETRSTVVSPYPPPQEYATRSLRCSRRRRRLCCRLCH